jgi:hypothetical protein
MHLSPSQTDSRHFPDIFLQKPTCGNQTKFSTVSQKNVTDLVKSDIGEYDCTAIGREDEDKTTY